MINEYLKKYFDNPLKPVIKCKDGFSMSVQASKTHYCFPRADGGPYTAVEIGFISDPEPLLLPYTIDKENQTETVHGWVPIEVAEAVILKHGGPA